MHVSLLNILINFLFFIFFSLFLFFKTSLFLRIHILLTQIVVKHFYNSTLPIKYLIFFKSILCCTWQLHFNQEFFYDDPSLLILTLTTQKCFSINHRCFFLHFDPIINFFIQLLSRSFEYLCYGSTAIINN